jgi:PRC-barrel domain
MFANSALEWTMIRKLTLITIVALSCGVNAQAQSPATPAPSPSPSGTVMQSDEQLLLANLRQQPVYSADNVGLGEIDDFLVERNGTVKSVIIDIGRGGAPKRVAIPMAALDFQKPRTAAPEPRSLKIIVKMSREELFSAPLFTADDGK